MRCGVSVSRTAGMLAAFVLLACGRHDPESVARRGDACLDAGDPHGAVAAFERALGDFARDNPGRVTASLGRCRALAQIDGAAARTAFAEHARAFPDAVDEVQVEDMALRLLQAGHPLASIEVLDDARAHLSNEQLGPSVQRHVDRLRQLPERPRAVWVCPGVE
jgi:hypothetical protein